MGLKFNFTNITATGNNNSKPQDTDYDGVAVTPSNSVDLPNGPCYGIYVTGAGDVAINIDGAGTKTAIVTFPANTLILVPATRIKVTSTTATGIYAIY
jgi:hypothetical protein